jgi:hypothetical protein
MARTTRRPLPSGKLTVPHATAFAAISSAAGVGLLAVYGSPLLACLAGGNVILYALCYTPLKQISIWNTWVGAVVGQHPICPIVAGSFLLVIPRIDLISVWKNPKPPLKSRMRTEATGKGTGTARARAHTWHRHAHTRTRAQTPRADSPLL